MIRAADLLDLSYGALKSRLDAGHPIDASTLHNTEYHGVALGNPAWIESLSWKTFKKVFRHDEARGVLRGWNVAVEQQGVEGPYVDRLRGGKPVTYWPYEVHPAADYTMPGPWGFGLCIDYGKSHGRLSFQGRIRDPLVAMNEGSSELLLGFSYFEGGLFRVPLPAFFLLQRGGPLTYDVPPR